jgi:hypothetical protein
MAREAPGLHSSGTAVKHLQSGGQEIEVKLSDNAYGVSHHWKSVDF